MEQTELMGMIQQIDRKSRVSFEDSLDKHFDEIKETANQSVVIKAVKDAYGNSLEAIGTDNKVEDFTTFSLGNNTLNWYLWLALYNDSWVFKRAIDKPSQDEVRCGITIQGQSDYSKIYARLNKYRTDLIQLLQWGALFGGSIACLMFDNIEDEDYSKPMNIAKCQEAKTMRMYVVDRWYGVAPSEETVDKMGNIDFGKPKYYDVTLADGNTVRFHHDYVLRYEHRFAPQLIKRGMLQGWGYAEGAHIINEITRDEKLKASVQSLIDKSLIEVIKMSGMRGVFMGADKDNEQQLRKRLEMVNWGRTFNSLTFLDKDDDYQQNEYSGLTGLADILEKNMWLISAALDMQGVLYGDLSNGMSHDEDALERYDETINNRCENYFRPVLEKFLKILFKLEKITDHVEFTFNSLLVKKQDDEHMESVKRFVDLASQLLSDGVIDLVQYAKALQLYTTKNIINFGFDDEMIKKLEEKQTEEDEAFEEDLMGNGGEDAL